MFEDLVKKYAMEDEIKPSKKRIKANCSALRSLIEQEESMNNNRKPSKIFKKPFALAAAIAVCVCLTSVTVFAASSGLFKSIKKAFYNDDNALRASEPSEYAFIPNVDSITGDGVTLNVTEAIADSHGLRIFMDMIFENGIPSEVLNDNNFTLDSMDFLDYEITNEGVGLHTDGVSVEDNIISLYITIGGIQENEWEKDGFTIGVKNFGYFTEPGEFITVSDISGKIKIPSEQIKRNNSVTAYSSIDGVSVKMELSLLGINMIFDSREDYDKFTHSEDGAIITPWNLCVYMKDSTVYGNGKNMDKAMILVDGGAGGTNPDGTFYHYINFDIPVDIENVEKITLFNCEFCFE